MSNIQGGEMAVWKFIWINHGRKISNFDENYKPTDPQSSVTWNMKQRNLNTTVPKYIIIKLSKISVKKKIFEVVTDKRHFWHRGAKISVTAESSLETMQAKGREPSLKYRRKITCQPRFSTQWKHLSKLMANWVLRN